MKLAKPSLKLQALIILCLTLVITLEASRTSDQQTHAVVEGLSTTLSASDLAQIQGEAMVASRSASNLYDVEIVATNKSKYVFDVTYKVTNLSDNARSPLEFGVISAYQIDWLTVSSSDASGNKVSSVYGTLLQPGQSMEITKAWMLVNPNADVYLEWKDLIEGETYGLH